LPESRTTKVSQESPPLVDPLAGLSKRPKMNRRGLYVDGGISEYSLAVVRPGRRLLSQRKPNESILDFLKREDPTRIRNVIFAGLPAVEKKRSLKHVGGGSGPKRLGALRAFLHMFR